MSFIEFSDIAAEQISMQSLCCELAEEFTIHRVYVESLTYKYMGSILYGYLFRYSLGYITIILLINLYNIPTLKSKLLYYLLFRNACDQIFLLTPFLRIASPDRINVPASRKLIKKKKNFSPYNTHAPYAAL